MNRPEISTQEIMQAIKRSGYLLESEITKTLASQGYFIESNQSILNPLTKKSREIDLVAEYYEYDEKTANNKTCAKIYFVFEIKNNFFPLVLLTKMEFSPNTQVWEGLKEILTIPDGIEYSFYEGFYEELLRDEEYLYTQYCSFQKKKGNKDELMAFHPENLYSGIAKITQYCDEAVNRWNNDSGEDEEIENYKDDYFRHFLYIPILLINDSLYELDINEENKTDLRKVESSKLVYNYHLMDEPKNSVIFVMTKKGLNDFLPQMRALERKVVEKMLKAKKH
ncbi:MAG: hypothetical protein NUV86_00520 [Candidatus Scalindua sp.]|nr:hypothetical protein [Candidatus Scalindua sp.]MCR4343385.1 hypothetical protein [Candidatus Scalindua sp.]